MADGLTKKLTLHQALHGYADGHRLLASSTSLKSRDQKTMLIMSDASGAGITMRPAGYLTGYPLPESGFYALARTWGATEMARPGCVFTHTFLLDFADLASLKSMAFLDRLFRRPGQAFALDTYEQPITTVLSDSDVSSYTSFGDVLRQILLGLYVFPKEKIVTPLSNVSDDVVFAVWAQQWPRLRRTFRFCTGSFADRSTEGARFDLQFAPIHDRAYRTRFSDALDIGKIDQDAREWLDEAIADIFAGAGGQLRAFLRDIGGETPGGRELFAPLCTLHAIIPQFDAGATSIDEAIALIESSFDLSQATSLRSMLVGAAARHPNNLSVRSAELILSNLDLIDANEPGSLGTALWKLIPESFFSAANSNPTAEKLLSATVQNLDSHSLLDTLLNHRALVEPVLNRRPDLLTDTAFWRSPESNQFIRFIKTSGAPLETVLVAVSASGRTDAGESIVAEFGVTETIRSLSAIKQRMGNQATPLQLWLDICVRDSGGLAGALNCDCDLSVDVLFEIARKSYPDYVPNDIGADPWANAIHKCRGRLREEQQQYFSAYILSRALGYRSHSQAELLEYAFDEVYFGAWNDRLPENAWQLVDRALPRSGSVDWDRCQRLRDAVTEMFVNRDLPPEDLSKVTRDNSTFLEMVELASRTSRGRRYLKKVLRSLKRGGSSETRIRIVEMAI